MYKEGDWNGRGKRTANDTPEAVFGELYQKHEPVLYRLALRVTKSDQSSRDIVQEVFLKLWEHFPEIADIHNMEAWLYRVTENKLMDFLRKMAADGRLRQALWKRATLSTHETEELLQAKECSSVIHKAVKELPPQRQLIYQLNREKGLSYQQIAEVLSISRHTVKNQLSMALRSIQRFLLLGAGTLLVLLLS